MQTLQSFDRPAIVRVETNCPARIVWEASSAPDEERITRDYFHAVSRLARNTIEKLGTKYPALFTSNG